MSLYKGYHRHGENTGYHRSRALKFAVGPRAGIHVRVAGLRLLTNGPISYGFAFRFPFLNNSLMVVLTKCACAFLPFCELL